MKTQIKLSNCCGASIVEETDFCSKCMEHCEIITEEVHDCGVSLSDNVKEDCSSSLPFNWKDYCSRNSKKRVKPTHVLKRYGIIQFVGSENDCYHQLQRSQSQSADWAMKYEGWSISPILYKNK